MSSSCLHSTESFGTWTVCRFSGRGWPASGASSSRCRWPSPPLAQAATHADSAADPARRTRSAADLDNRRFTLTFAQPVPVKDLLLLLVRGTSLSLIPDPAIDGSFIGELKNVTVRQALDSILPPLGLDYRVDGRVHSRLPREPETRIFDINYIASERSSTSICRQRGRSGTSAPRACRRRTGRPLRGSHGWRPDTVVGERDLQPGSQGWTASGHRLPGASRSHRRSIWMQSRAAPTGRSSSTRRSSRSS